jgi:hypothetical protein
MTLKRRLKELEAKHGATDEVTLLEWVLWSMRPEEWQRSDDPENLDFLRRLEKSELHRLVEMSVQRSI